MKANELRIGNFLQTKQTEKTFQVKEITKRTESVLESQCKPILLTDDWLLKFGFNDEDTRSGYLSHGSDKSYFVTDGVSFWFGDEEFELLNIRYVHQLQNLYFALTNTELEIK